MIYLLYGWNRVCVVEGGIVPTSVFPDSTAGLISVYTTYVYPFSVESIFRRKNTTILRIFHVFLRFCDLVYLVDRTHKN
jgi:hypothetical protein